MVLQRRVHEARTISAWQRNDHGPVIRDDQAIRISSATLADHAIIELVGAGLKPPLHTTALRLPQRGEVGQQAIQTVSGKGIVVAANHSFAVDQHET